MCNLFFETDVRYKQTMSKIDMFNYVSQIVKVARKRNCLKYHLPTLHTHKSIFKGSLKNTPVSHSMIRVLALILQHGKINATDQLTVLSALYKVHTIPLAYIVCMYFKSGWQWHSDADLVW